MKKQIVYIHNGLSSFVEKDIEILNEVFNVIPFHFDVKVKWKVIFSFIHQFFFLLKFGFKSKVLVIQFGGYHSYLAVQFAKLTGKKSIIILGGTDCVSFPSIRYGSFYKKVLGYFTGKSLQKASILLPVDATLVDYQYSYQTNDFPRQGYLFHAPYVKTPFKVIYNGYDSSKWKSLPKETNSFITVGANLSSRFGRALKGIDIILDIAAEFPECKFYIVGGALLNESVPSNVELMPVIPNNKLNKLLGEKQFYLQLSMSEGFPNALCEAMLCECIPIVSNVGAMPMIVQENGFILATKDKKLLKLIIEDALRTRTKEDIGHNARKSIIDRFPIERRKKELADTIVELIG
jgi:glycosyltransferase involved in cell wall biosynthesis